MDGLSVSDWTAIYAACLSTMVAVVGIVRWFRDRPRLSLIVFGPRGVRLGNERTFLTIISNSGSRPVVVERVSFSFRNSRWFRGKEIGRADFDESTPWKPSVKQEPIEGKPNHVREVPNVLHPNAEIRAYASAVKDYDQQLHWIRASAKIRNSEKAFVGWLPPSPLGETTNA